jgi:hypothetical protein
VGYGEGAVLLIMPMKKRGGSGNVLIVLVQNGRNCWRSFRKTYALGTGVYTNAIRGARTQSCEVGGIESLAVLWYLLCFH